MSLVVFCVSAIFTNKINFSPCYCYCKKYFFSFSCCIFFSAGLNTSKKKIVDKMLASSHAYKLRTVKKKVVIKHYGTNLIDFLCKRDFFLLIIVQKPKSKYVVKLLLLLLFFLQCDFPRWSQILLDFTRAECNQWRYYNH